MSYNPAHGFPRVVPELRYKAPNAAIEWLVRQAIRKAAAEHLIDRGKRLREPGGPEITEAELESELKAVRAELREARARRP